MLNIDGKAIFLGLNRICRQSMSSKNGNIHRPLCKISQSDGLFTSILADTSKGMRAFVFSLSSFTYHSVRQATVRCSNFVNQDSSSQFNCILAIVVE